MSYVPVLGNKIWYNSNYKIIQPSPCDVAFVGSCLKTTYTMLNCPHIQFSQTNLAESERTEGKRVQLISIFTTPGRIIPLGGPNDAPSLRWDFSKVFENWSKDAPKNSCKGLFSALLGTG